jgi:chromosome condensin MukBEF complex kleisin-like MukF subunit
MNTWPEHFTEPDILLAKVRMAMADGETLLEKEALVGGLLTTLAFEELEALNKKLKDTIQDLNLSESSWVRPLQVSVEQMFRHQEQQIIEVIIEVDKKAEVQTRKAHMRARGCDCGVWEDGKLTWPHPECVCQNKKDEEHD